MLHMFSLMEFDFINILPIIGTVTAVGYKVYYDVSRLKGDVTEGFVNIGVKLDKMEESISNIKLDLVENKTEDKFRDKELVRLSKEIEKLQSP